MSEASSSTTRSSNGRKLTADGLVAKLHKKAGVASDARFSLTDHLSAGRTLVQLRDALLAGEQLSARSAVVLLCTGIALRRRHATSDVPQDEEGASADASVKQDREASRALLLESAHLVFALLCILEKRNEGVNTDHASSVIEHVNDTSLWDVLKPRTKKRPREGEEAGEGEEGAEEEAAGEPGEGEDAAAWREAMRVNSAEIARHALRIGASQLAEGLSYPVMALYFRSASTNMAARMLVKTSDEFVALGVNQGDATVPREKRLLAIVQAAESEAGQSILRDMVLSFLLPSSVVGVRRGLLLSRAASTHAGIDHPTVVGRGHDTAMAGAEFIWTNGDDELERMCCLLSGLAILTTKGGSDPIRKLEAFNGRVSLPFLETTGLGQLGPRLVLFPEARRWVLYRLDSKGTPKVLSSLSGFDGLCTCALAMVAT